VTACHFPLEKWPMTEDEIRSAPVGQRTAAPAP
jgi:hypothetical protein